MLKWIKQGDSQTKKEENLKRSIAQRKKAEIQSQKRASCNQSVDIFQQAFYQQVNASTDLLQVVTSL